MPETGEAWHPQNEIRQWIETKIDCKYKSLGGLEHNPLEENVLSIHKALREEPLILKKDHVRPSGFGVIFLHPSLTRRSFGLGTGDVFFLAVMKVCATERAGAWGSNWKTIAAVASPWVRQFDLTGSLRVESMLNRCFPTFLMHQPFNPIPHAVVNPPLPSHKIIFVATP